MVKRGLTKLLFSVLLVFILLAAFAAAEFPFSAFLNSMFSLSGSAVADIEEGSNISEIQNTTCNITFKVSGNKFNNATFYLFDKSDEIISTATIERVAGNPEEQAESIQPDIKSDAFPYYLNISAFCGDENGANPVFIESGKKQDNLGVLNCNVNNPDLSLGPMDVSSFLNGSCIIQISENETKNQTTNETANETSCTPLSETCNGADDDCDYLVDEELTENCGISDVGACEFGTIICSEGSWEECSGEIDPDIEICDGLDNDCDGLVDEELVQECGTNEGTCSKGTQSCVNGAWGDCSGNYKGPKQEICNGIDDDCNGKIDDEIDCTCIDEQERGCGSDVGECKAGIQLCSYGEWEECEGAISPVDEICDGKDNDCDGSIDEDLTKQCGDSFIGACKLGTQKCMVGEWQACEGAINPSYEICDGMDNDCDGKADESLFRTCGSSNMGECIFGLKQCSNGIWSDCEGNIEPAAETCDSLDNDCDGEIDNNCGQEQQCVPSQEICDGLDNDCDGLIDEDLTKSCGSNAGVCKEGTQTCSDGMWGECIGDVKPSEEICNGMDDNCDGLIDEEMVQSCGIDVGICKSGQQVCSNGLWGSCQGSITPSEEICNGMDDNCDGLIDNGLNCNCKEGETQPCGTDIGECKVGTQICSNGIWGMCIDGVEPAAEICDSSDNDCDGLVDEDLTSTIGQTDIGECSYGEEICVNGSKVIGKEPILPASEMCDGLDNDCDGNVDDSVFQDCSSNIGECILGQQLCVNGQWSECSGVMPKEEAINGLDDDCNGIIDDMLNETQNETAEQPQTPSTGGGGSGGGGGKKTESQPLMLLPSSFSSSIIGKIVDKDKGQMELEKDLNLVITDYPQKIDIADNRFDVEALVENTGETDLENVDVEITASDGWNSAKSKIDRLAVGEKKSVTLNLESALCSNENQEKTLSFNKTKIELDATAKSGNAEDSEKVSVDLNIPAFASSAAANDYSKNSILRTCFFINNLGKSERDKLEIEYELADTKNDIIVDFLSPISAKEGEVLIKSFDYRLVDVPRLKTYYSTATLLENGSLFKKGYRVSQSRTEVDLRDLKAEKGLLRKILDSLGYKFRQK